MANPVEVWKSEKHSFDVWPDVERYAADATAMKEIPTPDLERMKWHGFFYRKRDNPGRYMTRIRITAGELSADAAREIAHIAYEYGHGIVDITTRANVQVQGLEITQLPKVAARFDKVGLSAKQTGHDNIRNVFAHPYSGLLPDELIDTRQLCHDVTALFVDSREYSDLPRKLNICLNGTDHHSAHFWTQDISFLACRLRLSDETRIAFQVLIGGTQGQNPHLAWHLPVLVEPSQVVAVTKCILDLFRAKGSREKRNAARFRFLVEEIGVGGVLEWLEEHLPFPLQPSVAEPSPATSGDEFVGWFRQKETTWVAGAGPQGSPGASDAGASPSSSPGHPGPLWTLGLSVPLGRLTWNQLEGLALLAKKWGDGQLRTTHEQGIAVINIPTGFKDAAATDAAALGLSVHADPFELNTMACTGSQFCNIAVTETKGHMFQLIEKLRKKALKLHGIRIHMSGCPSSCAQHFTADIGLKGVRVRRLLGTREGFDVYLGGGIAGQVHMGLPYKLGVDVDQLPTLVESVVEEFYLRHKSGQTFSAYWREKLQALEAEKVGDDDYQLPTWICESCDYDHKGEDPPVFCPSCAGLRRNFARIEEGDGGTVGQSDKGTNEVAREDGFAFAAKLDQLSESEALGVQVDGNDVALYLVDGNVHAILDSCPHEGAQLSDGEVNDGVVTCPWHGWTFNACTGCSVEPAGNDVRSFETLVEDGRVFVKAGGETRGQSDKETGGQEFQVTRSDSPNVRLSDGPLSIAKPVTATLPVLDILQETPDVRTFRLDNSTAKIPLDYPGRFVKICVPIDGKDVWRSFTIASSPTQPQTIDLTIKRNPAGVVSNYLFDELEVGSTLKLKAPLGGFFFAPQKQTEPLVLVSAGSGITPMMSIARFLRDTGSDLPCTFLYGARSPADIIFHEECLRLAETSESFRYHATLSQPGDNWDGSVGRVCDDALIENIPDLPTARYFLCGPNAFMDELRTFLQSAGVPTDRIHTEQFHSSPTPVAQ